MECVNKFNNFRAHKLHKTTTISIQMRSYSTPEFNQSQFQQTLPYVPITFVIEKERNEEEI